MKKYKLNNYLLATRDSDDNIILYDTLEYRTVLVKKKDIDVFKDICLQVFNRGNYKGPQENLDLLLKHNIIKSITENIDEKLQKRYDEVVKGNKILSLIILPTEQCNFRCAYCYEDYKRGKMSEMTTNKLIQLIERLLPEYNMLNISWFGGEPLLAIDIIRFISEKVKIICKKNRKAYCAQITTNGYLLNLDVAEELIKMHITAFQVTIDGNRTIHNKQRYLADGSGTYDVILHNLLSIKESIKTKTIKIVVRINVSEEISEKEIHELVENFSDDKRFVFDIQNIFGDSAKETTDSSYYQDYLNILDKCQNSISDNLILENTICYASKSNVLLIRSDGTLGKCTTNFEDPNNDFGKLELLDIAHFSLESMEYCNSAHVKEDCISCCIYPLCFGKMCPAVRYQSCKKIIDKYSIIAKTYSSKAYELDFI